MDDPFLKSFAASTILAADGLTVMVRTFPTSAEAMAALSNGEADLGMFALDEDNRRALKASSDATNLLTRPFMFKSPEEVFLMQDSFLGGAAAADSGRSGLFPLKIWTHSIAWLLTREPVRTTEDFSRLKVAAEDGAPDSKILAATGAKPAGAMAAMERDGANAIETRLGPQTLALAAKMDGPLYLTIGWPETALLAAAPPFWPQIREIDKNAIKTAAEQARALANSDLMAREEAFRKLPNVAINRIDHDDQMQLAMRAGRRRGGNGRRKNALAPGRDRGAWPGPLLARKRRAPAGHGEDVAGAVRHRPQRRKRSRPRHALRRAPARSVRIHLRLSGRSGPPFRRAAPARRAAQPGQGRRALRARDRRADPRGGRRQDPVPDPRLQHRFRRPDVAGAATGLGPRLRRRHRRLELAVRRLGLFLCL